MAIKNITSEMHAPIIDVLFLKKVLSILPRMLGCFIATIPIS